MCMFCVYSAYQCVCRREMGLRSCCQSMLIPTPEGKDFTVNISCTPNLVRLCSTSLDITENHVVCCSHKCADSDEGEHDVLITS